MWWQRWLTTNETTAVDADLLSHRVHGRPGGLAEFLDALDTLADDARPPGSFHRGEYHRLRIGRYRVVYGITVETV